MYARFFAVKGRGIRCVFGECHLEMQICSQALACVSAGLTCAFVIFGRYAGMLLSCRSLQSCFQVSARAGLCAMTFATKRIHASVRCAGSILLVGVSWATQRPWLKFIDTCVRPSPYIPTRITRRGKTYNNDVAVESDIKTFSNPASARILLS